MRPVWSFSLERTTNAPLEVVVARLRDAEAFQQWHPRHRRAELRVVHEDAFRFEGLHETVHWGVAEQGHYLVTREGQGLLLTYEGRFKGWPVLLLMGWWRMSSNKLWERFVEHL